MKACGSDLSRLLLPLLRARHALLKEGPVKASPLAKKIARDNKVDLARLQGTGPGGRVVRKDVEAALSSGQPSAVSRQPAPSAPCPCFRTKMKRFN